MAASEIFITSKKNITNIMKTHEVNSFQSSESVYFDDLVLSSVILRYSYTCYPHVFLFGPGYQEA